jgi:hypothetical protein
MVGRRRQPKPSALARMATTARANAWAAGLRPTIEALQASGVTSLMGIARALDERNIPPPTGRRCWQAMQVRRLLARLKV